VILLGLVVLMGAVSFDSIAFFFSIELSFEPFSDENKEASISFLDSSRWVKISFSPPWRGRLWPTDKLLISSPSGVSTKLIFTLALD
jgi:hypothetical protein